MLTMLTDTRSLLDEARQSQVEMNTIYQDDASAIKMANDREATERSKRVKGSLSQDRHFC